MDEKQRIEIKIAQDHIQNLKKKQDMIFEDLCKKYPELDEDLLFDYLFNVFDNMEMNL